MVVIYIYTYNTIYKKCTRHVIKYTMDNNICNTDIYDIRTIHDNTS